MRLYSWAYSLGEWQFFKRFDTIESGEQYLKNKGYNRRYYKFQHEFGDVRLENDIRGKDGKAMKMKLNELLCADSDSEPRPDIAHCSTCGWEGESDKCDTDQDGDWESGYYAIHLCPNCEDGGCIDDYSMSEERAKEWREWAGPLPPPPGE